jgi:hypothetical protein
MDHPASADGRCQSNQTPEFPDAIFRRLNPATC